MENEQEEVEYGMILKNEEVSRLHVTSQNVIRYLKGPRNCKKQVQPCPKVDDKQADKELE